jgi:hypothetical protein
MDKMNFLRIGILVLSVVAFNLSTLAQSTLWGWQAHRYINEHAFDYLPSEMSFFLEHQNYVRDHAPDPDTDSNPGNYHYIDIDMYPEFFDGTLPHNQEELIDLYDLSTVEETGLVPWIVEEWTDSLKVLMESGQWVDVWQIAAELGHYVADSHQPLHLTENYNGQLTGNEGIHSRYETNMINSHLSELDLEPSIGEYWPNVIDSTFAYIDLIYPYNAEVFAADDLATEEDPNFNSTYYNIMWSELEVITTEAIRKACYDLACLWITAWENAGSPLPLNIESSNNNFEKDLISIHPNPTTTNTTIQVSVPNAGFVSIRIYDSHGQLVESIVSKQLNQGTHFYLWDATVYPKGIYYCRLMFENGLQQSQKLIRN